MSQALSVDEMAARWRIRMLDPHVTAQARAQFERWHAEPAHATAYAAMQRAWEVAGEEAADPQIRAIREAALRYPPARRRRTAAVVAAAASLLLAIGTGLWWAGDRLWSSSGSAPALVDVSEGHFHTAVGERATVRLSDGSVVTLNTGSRVQVALGEDARELRLLQGQAIFDVAQDPARPFVVFAADRRITALGTLFDVRVEKREVCVTLIEGKVAVDQLSASARQSDPSGHPVARAQLEPGEQLIAPLGGVAVVQGTNVERVTSWRAGRLIFEASRLADALAEMNRYTDTPIVLDDAAIGELRVSGVFRTGQPAAFAHALEQYFPLQAAERGGQTVLRWRR